jgi:hypothetical protein
MADEDNNMFAMAPADTTNDAVEQEETGGFTMLGDAPATEYVGEVDEAPMDFAAAPPSMEAPIILGDPTTMQVEDGSDDEQEENMQATLAPLSNNNEPTPMQKWNDEWNITLVQRKEEETIQKVEHETLAAASMDNFNKARETKREQKMSTNREDEQAKLEAIEADLENDNSWQRVCKMVELSHDGEQDGADVKRMRDVMILLKNEPVKAATVGA